MSKYLTFEDELSILEPEIEIIDEFRCDHLIITITIRVRGVKIRIWRDKGKSYKRILEEGKYELICKLREVIE
jgi:hypothetical protein